jgi:hypothetical protein
MGVNEVSFLKVLGKELAGRMISVGRHRRRRRGVVR